MVKPSEEAQMSKKTDAVGVIETVESPEALASQPLNDLLFSLEERINEFKTAHYESEDCWYSCPKSGECCKDNDEDECNCGADRQNSVVNECLVILNAITFKLTN